MSARVLETLHRIAASLARARVPPISPYWHDEVDRFYTHPTARLLVECVGRGGDKSRMSVLMAIAEVLAGEVQIAAGERHYFVHVAENVTEARKTLAVMGEYLKTLSVAHDRIENTIELRDMPRGIRVLACRIGAVSGYRCIGWTADECAKWNDEGADPSAEMIASIRAMTVTHPNARGRIISSPLGAVGYFYDQWSAGNSESQIAGHAPSWVANPSITEEYTHTLEGDERVWRREYAAIPQSGALDAFDAELVDIAHNELPFRYTACTPAICVVDPSDMDGPSACEYAGGLAMWVSRQWRNGDQYVYQEVRDARGYYRGKYVKRDANGNPIRPPDYESTFGIPVLMIHRVWGARGWLDDIHDHIARECTGRTSVVVGDQHGYAGNVAGLSRRGLQYVKRTWNAENKQQAFSFLRRLLREGRLLLDPYATPEDWQILRRQCLGMQETISGGALHYSPKSGVLADRLSVIVGAAMASLPSHEKDPPLFGTDSPMTDAPPRGRRTFGPGEIPPPTEQ